MSDIPSARRLACESSVVALYSPSSPLKASSPYHAFARSPATVLFGTPALWPGPRGSATTARLLWNESALFVCWELEGNVSLPVTPSQVDPECFGALLDGAAPADQRMVLLDERVECFLWRPETDSPTARQTYFAFEVGYGGKALTTRARFDGTKDFTWGSEAYVAWSQNLPVGWSGAASPTPSQMAGVPQPNKRVVIAEFQWSAVGMTPGPGLRIGLHRAEYPSGGPTGVLGKSEVDKLLGEMVWTSWIDPGDDVVNFHRPEMFGTLELVSGMQTTCWCKAARLTSPTVLSVVDSPKPSLDECPAGSLLVDAKYASVCGSDMPYFKAAKFMAPSCYWDRDGFCGHEVLGIVIASKSISFQPGDAVMALPSSYFKAHVSSKQEWYREEVHGVLLKDFPVRGGFSKVYTSHELYCYKIKECVPRALAAQGLGTVLKMARKLGSVIGKTVVVVGQGQNGLIATRLMSQLCAKTVIAVDPLEYRRQISLTFGANQAVSPEQAQAVIFASTHGRGADVVLEMVGHNQQTINECLGYVASSGIIMAFGVPDDAVYSFSYSLLFRKNVTLMTTVVPDPGVDFPEAVRLVEEGRFNTDGIFTHSMPLERVHEAFVLASSYTDEVVKLVIEF